MSKVVMIGSLWVSNKEARSFKIGELVEIYGISLFSDKSEIYVKTRRGVTKLAHDEFLTQFEKDKE